MTKHGMRVYSVRMRLELPKSGSREVLEYLAGLPEIAAGDEVELDFGQVSVLTSFYMLALGTALRRELAGKECRLRFTGFQREAVENYAGYMGMKHLLDETLPVEGLKEAEQDEGTHLPITRLSMKDLFKAAFEQRRFLEAGDLIEEQAQRLARVVTAHTPELAPLMGFLIREILRNIPEHGNADEMWICAQRWKSSFAELTILDEGIGIFNSLASNPKHREYITDNEQALQWAVKPGISQSFQPSYKPNKRSQWENSGYGLYMVSGICRELGGKFLLASYGNYISLRKDGTFERGATDFHGTVLRISIPTGRELDTQDLLRRLSEAGEREASTIRNAFKQASKPSRGLLTELGIDAPPQG